MRDGMKVEGENLYMRERDEKMISPMNHSEGNKQ